MLRKYSLLLIFCGIFICRVSSVTAEGTTIGAHVKMTLYDYKDGKSNGEKSHEYAGMALNEVIIYFSSQISDRISVDLQPLIDAKTGATPQFGEKIGGKEAYTLLHNYGYEENHNYWQRTANLQQLIVKKERRIKDD